VADRGERHFVVVTRKGKVPLSRHFHLDEAADYIVWHRAYATYTVMAQDGKPSAPMRKLTRDEAKRLERRLFPSLHD
jgi:hypothetical protein